MPTRALREVSCWVGTLIPILTALSSLPVSAPHPSTAAHECVLLQRLDEAAPYVSDADECAVPTAPASTFKIPHALIALATGAVSGVGEVVPWDGTRQPFPAWERPHSLDSAVRSSVVWFFQRTARRIGPDRMRDSLRALDYAADTFDGDVASFWLNGDLVVTPEEQLRFLRRLARFDLPARRELMAAVLETFRMPPGLITNASGSHDFRLDWPGPLVVHAKTGNTTVAEQRVSWLVGYVESRGITYAFVSRVRADDALAGTAGADLARRVLNARKPAPGRVPRIP